MTNAFFEKEKNATTLSIFLKDVGTTTAYYRVLKTDCCFSPLYCVGEVISCEVTFISDFHIF